MLLQQKVNFDKSKNAAYKAVVIANYLYSKMFNSEWKGEGEELEKGEIKILWMVFGP